MVAAPPAEADAAGDKFLDEDEVMGYFIQVARGLDEDLALDELCSISLTDLLPPIREARFESFEDDCLVVKIGYLSPSEAAPG